MDDHASHSNDANADDALNRYVLDHYRHLMTDDELEIITALGLNLKALRNPSHIASKKLAHARGLVEKPHVQAAINNGYTESRTRIRKRLLNEYGEQIYLNRCPRCVALCRTPAARMCAACGYSWHDQGCEEN